MTYIWLIGFALLYFPVNKLANYIKMPRVIIYLLIGILIGENTTGVIDSSLNNDDLIKYLFSITLIVTLIKGMLSINFDAIKKHKKLVLMLSFVPVLLEALLISIVAMFFFGFGSEGFKSSIILGLIIAPVSPAIIVPALTKLIDTGIGNKRGLPSVQLLASSLDDLFSVLVFYLMVMFAFDANLSLTLFTITMLCMPLALLYKKVRSNTNKEYFVISWIRNFSAAAMFIILGSLLQVNTDTVSLAGMFAILLAVSAVARFAGVWISMRKYPANERNFSLISNIPKATVQATLGPLPLVFGIAFGNEILILSILYIIITAPIGAILLDKKAKGLLDV